MNVLDTRAGTFARVAWRIITQLAIAFGIGAVADLTTVQVAGAQAVIGIAFIVATSWNEHRLGGRIDLGQIAREVVRNVVTIGAMFGTKIDAAGLLAVIVAVEGLMAGSRSVLAEDTRPDGEEPIDDDIGSFLAGDDTDELDAARTLAAPKPGSADAFVAWCRSQVGVSEKRGNVNPYAPAAGHGNGQAWCASFVSAGLIACGVLPRGHDVLVASSRTMFERAAKRGWRVALSDVQPGDIPHTRRGLPKRWLGHVGVVETVTRDARGRVVAIKTIEGNTNSAGSATGGSVLRENRPVAFWLLGFWRPPFR